VLQEPRRIDAWIRTKAYKDARVVAVPSRFLDARTKCAQSPRLCAEVIAAVADVVGATDGKWLHLLGPPKRVLRVLRPLLGHYVRSIDSLGYRLAASKDVRVRMEPGMEETYLRAWLRGLLL